MEKNTPFRAKNPRWPPDLQKKILKVFENIFSMVFEVAHSDYGIDFCLFLKAKKFQNLLSPPLKKIIARPVYHMF